MVLTAAINVSRNVCFLSCFRSKLQHWQKSHPITCMFEWNDHKITHSMQNRWSKLGNFNTGPVTPSYDNEMWLHTHNDSASRNTYKNMLISGQNLCCMHGYLIISTSFKQINQKYKKKNMNNDWKSDTAICLTCHVSFLFLQSCIYHLLVSSCEDCGREPSFDSVHLQVSMSCQTYGWVRTVTILTKRVII